MTINYSKLFKFNKVHITKYEQQIHSMWSSYKSSTRKILGYKVSIKQ